MGFRGKDGKKHVVGVVQAITGSDHGVTQSISRDRELDRHEWRLMPVVELERLLVEMAIGLESLQNRLTDQPGQEVVEDHILVVKAHKLLDRRQVQGRVVLA